jgi:DME family drug/metabolite transporter
VITVLRLALALPVLGLLISMGPSEEMFPALTWSDVLGIVLLALIPGLLALILYYQGLRSTPAPPATLAELSFPLTAVCLNFLVFGTGLSATRWLGVATLLLTIGAMSWLTFQGAEQSKAIGIETPARIDTGRGEPR